MDTITGLLFLFTLILIRDEASCCCRTGDSATRMHLYGGVYKEYQRIGLRKHNEYRRKHNNTPAMQLTAELCNMADKCAEYYMEKGRIDHSCPDKKNVGENLYVLYAKGDENKVAGNAVDSWYSEIKNYDFDTGSGKGVVGHFTQVVWKGSTELGIGFATNGKASYLVGIYRKPGNYVGRNKENVLPPS